jgi:dienelactone hydrolase
MATVLLFHQAQGLTAGCLDFADELRAAGHVVHTPDLYEGRTFTKLSGGMEYAGSVGFETILQRGIRAAESYPDDLVYAGFSLGGMSAQKLTQSRPGARGTILLHTAIPLSEFGGTWPSGVPLQIHTMEQDEYGDVDVARQLVQEIERAELFVYPGDRHLFTDNSLPDYDEGAATLVRERVLRFLQTVG